MIRSLWPWLLLFVVVLTALLLMRRTTLPDPVPPPAFQTEVEFYLAPGMTVEQVAHIVHLHTNVELFELVLALRSDELGKEFRLPTGRVDGYLIAGTYKLPTGGKLSVKETAAALVLQSTAFFRELALADWWHFYHEPAVIFRLVYLASPQSPLMLVGTPQKEECISPGDLQIVTEYAMGCIISDLPGQKREDLVKTCPELPRGHGVLSPQAVLCTRNLLKSPIYPSVEAVKNYKARLLAGLE